MHLPVSREEIQAAWSNPYTDSSVFLIYGTEKVTMIDG